MTRVVAIEANLHVALAKQMGSEIIELSNLTGREVPVGDQPGKAARNDG